MMKKNSFAHRRRETEGSQRITYSAIPHTVGDDVYLLCAAALSDEHQEPLEMLRRPDDIRLIGRVVFDSTLGWPAIENSVMGHDLPPLHSHDILRCVRHRSEEHTS